MCYNTTTIISTTLLFLSWFLIFLLHIIICSQCCTSRIPYRWWLKSVHTSNRSFFAVLIYFLVLVQHLLLKQLIFAEHLYTSTFLVNFVVMKSIKYLVAAIQIIWRNWVPLGLIDLTGIFNIHMYSKCNKKCTQNGSHDLISSNISSEW